MTRNTTVVQIVNGAGQGMIIVRVMNVWTSRMGLWLRKKVSTIFNCFSTLQIVRERVWCQTGVNYCPRYEYGDFKGGIVADKKVSIF